MAPRSVGARVLMTRWVVRSVFMAAPGGSEVEAAGASCPPIAQCAVGDGCGACVAGDLTRYCCFVQYLTQPRNAMSMHPDLPPLRLMDQLRHQIRYLHYSIRTEQAYVHWVRAFVRFHGFLPPAVRGGAGGGGAPAPPGGGPPPG